MIAHVHVLNDNGTVGNEIGACSRTLGHWSTICEIVSYNARDNGYPGCTEDDIGSVEDDEYGEIITVCGDIYAVIL